MRKYALIASALAALLLLSGCETWKAGGSVVSGNKGAFEVRPPADWRYATGFGAELVASKDGPILQQITIEQRELKDALKHSKRLLTAELAPFEVAEAYVDDLKSDRDLLALELQENTPTAFGGVPGFKLVYRFRTKEKLRLTMATYGAIHGGKLWLLHLRAPSRHYFERDLPAFEATAQSFRFGPASAK